MKVYEAIAKVMAELAKDGIQKNSKNTQQGYQFRGIDAVYNALAPKLAAHGLCVLPRVLTRETTERATKSGSVLFYTVLEVEFDFVSAEDGSKHTIRTIGEAMDSADKSTNKAMSAAYKYACLQAFCIPTEGDNDADATTHEVATKVSRKSPAEIQAELEAYIFAIEDAETMKTLGDVWVKVGEWMKQNRISEDARNALIDAKNAAKARIDAHREAA